MDDDGRKGSEEETILDQMVYVKLCRGRIHPLTEIPRTRHAKKQDCRVMGLGFVRDKVVGWDGDGTEHVDEKEIYG